MTLSLLSTPFVSLLSNSVTSPTIHTGLVASSKPYFVRFARALFPDLQEIPPLRQRTRNLLLKEAKS